VRRRVSNPRFSVRAALLGAAFASAALLGAAAMTAAPAAPASAHSEIIDSVPREGETLTQLPAEFSVTANESLAVLPEGFALEIIDAEGRHYETGRTTVRGPVLSTEAIIGEPGEYELVYQVVSGDGHPVAGRIAFTWAPDGTVPPSESNAGGIPATVAPAEPEDTGSADGGAGTGAGVLEGPMLALAIVVPVVIVAGLIATLIVTLRRRGQL